MKRLIPLALCALALPASPQTAATPAFTGYLSAWRQDCSAGCAPAIRAGRSEAVGFTLAVPTVPGEARATSFERDLVFGPAGEKVKASFSVYFVCPAGARPGAGGDPCPSRYLQVQAVLSGAARAFCAASLNMADAHPFPVMMCAGENVRRPGERLGVSLSREVPRD